MRFLFSTTILITGLMAPALMAQQSVAKSGNEVSDPAKAAQGAAQAKGGTRDTPFGRVRQDANPQPAPKPKKPSETGLVRAEVKGDTVTFRRKTPFGNQVWTRKRSELNDDEQDILANQSSSESNGGEARPKPAAAPKPAAQPKTSEEVAARPE